MDQIKKFLEYILEVEGKTSSDPDDGAASCYPGGIHTNKGITYCKWQTAANKFGWDPSHDSFLNMTCDQWDRIIYDLYLNNSAYAGWWKTYETRPVAAMFLIDWAFNRGQNGMESDLAKWEREKLGIVDNNITIPEILTNIRLSNMCEKLGIVDNNITIPEILTNIRLSNMSDHMMLLSLFYRRIRVYENIAKRNPKKAKYLPGWRRRFKKFYIRFAPQDVIDTLKSQGVSFSGL